MDRLEECIQLDAIKAEGQHVWVSVLFLERLVEDLVELVKLLLVAVQAIENAMFNFGPALLDSRLKVCQALLQELVIDSLIAALEEQIWVDGDSLFDVFDIDAGVDETVRLVLQVVRPLDLQLTAVKRRVVHDHRQGVSLILLALLLLVLALLDCL